MAELGYWTIVLTFLVSIYVAIASIVGTRRRITALSDSARNGIFVAAASSTVASAILVQLLLARDLGVRYVFEHVNSVLPTAYTLSAFWAGQEGSLLMWLWLVTLLGVAIAVWKRMWQAPVGPYALAVVALTQAFLAAVLLLASNPFQTMPQQAVDGQGLNPLLQNFWMIVHPPIVFMGYAAYTVPFALALGGLITGQMGRTWLGLVRRWSLFAWLFLGIGILMGAWWAYLELGWGGYWAWDPVENSSFLPWLTGTALLHSLMMQERRGTFKTWTLWLIGLTFALCVFATFVTRSGIIQSVHAFGRSAIGYFFMAFIALCLLTLAWLLYLRRRELGEEQELRALFSRETSLFVTNLVLLGTALVILVGTLFPALAELVQGRQATLDVSFYERTVGPLAQVVIILIGVCPWLAWGGVSMSRLRRELLPPAVGGILTPAVLLAFGVHEVPALISFAVSAFVALSLLATFYRGTVDRRHRTGEGIFQAFFGTVFHFKRRYGAHIVHLGIVLIAVGVTGSTIYQDEVQVALSPGEKVDVGGYTLEYEEFVPQETPGYQRFTAVVDTYRGDKLIARLRPTKDFYWNVEQWVTEVAIRSTPKEDLYVILAGFEQSELASFRVLINPLVIWLWVGGAVLLVGGVMAWWPSRPEGRAQ
jgi:cytochrome c-type biogenesis protein CcmF